MGARQGTDARRPRPQDPRAATRGRRTVKQLAPLAQDLLEWRLASGRPGDDEPVIPGARGGAWTDDGYYQWRGKVWTPTLKDAGVPHQVPYDLRHSFASLLLHEGRSVIYVARQLGHDATLTLKTYGHVIDELEDQPQSRPRTPSAPPARRPPGRRTRPPVILEFAQCSQPPPPASGISGAPIAPQSRSWCGFAGV